MSMVEISLSVKGQKATLEVVGEQGAHCESTLRKLLQDIGQNAETGNIIRKDEYYNNAQQGAGVSEGG